MRKSQFKYETNETNDEKVLPMKYRNIVDFLKSNDAHTRNMNVEKYFLDNLEVDDDSHEEEQHTTQALLKYPFKTKTKVEKYYKGIITNANHVEHYAHDYKVKPLKDKFMRPEFAPNPYSWEIDHIHKQSQIGAVSYLACININTKFVYLYPAKDRTMTTTSLLLFKLKKDEEEMFGHPVHHIRSDGDRGFESLSKDCSRLFGFKSWYINSSPYVYHNKVVDAVIRTLRNALGKVRQDEQYIFNGGKENDKIIQQLVKYYNNTWHSAIRMTPLEMHTDISKEWAFIRRKTEELNDAKRIQQIYQLNEFRPGEVVRVYLDHSKDGMRYVKRRMNFDTWGIFKGYDHGNGIVEIQMRVRDEYNKIVIDSFEVVLPIYFIKHARDEDNLTL